MCDDCYFWRCLSKLFLVGGEMTQTLYALMNKRKQIVISGKGRKHTRITGSLF
jgi:hypothetical protein